MNGEIQQADGKIITKGRCRTMTIRELAVRLRRPNVVPVSLFRISLAVVNPDVRQRPK